MGYGFLDVQTNQLCKECVFCCLLKYSTNSVESNEIMCVFVLYLFTELYDLSFHPSH